MSDTEEQVRAKTAGSQSNHLIDDAAEQSDEEELDKLVDSSEEDDDDDDEEAIRAVTEGFIVDDDEEESRKKRRKHKKRHRQPQEEEELDEDDLALLRENNGELLGQRAESTQFKRLKRGGNDDNDSIQQSRGLDSMFSDEEGQDDEGGIDANDDDEDEDDLMEASKLRQQQQQQQHQPDLRGEFDDFIEDDEFSDDDEDRDEKLARIRSNRARQMQFAQTSQLDQDKLDELYEIFGDGEEYGWALDAEAADEDDEGDKFDEYGQLVRKAKKDSHALNEVFEFEELKEHLLTEKDQTIRETDVPERFQTLRENITNYELDDEAFEEKQKWVAETLYQEKLALFQEKDLNEKAFLKAVGDIVTFIARENLEVPTIWNCRKDYTLHTYRENGQLRVQKLLNENDLWRILQLDIDFHAIYEKKNAIKKMYEALPPDTLDLIYDEFMKSAKTISELQDLHDYLSFTYSEELKDKMKSGFKSHSKYTQFEKIKKHEIYYVVKNMGIDAEKFGDNVAQGTKIFITDDYSVTPEELIQDYIKPGSFFDTEEKAMSAVKRMFAEQISVNPKVRAHVRSTFEKYAIIDIELTAKGKTKITDSSPFADFKYAANRNTSSFLFSPDLFLRMLEAEQLGYVNIKVGLKNAFENFSNHLFSSMSSDGTSDVSNAWNKLRKQCMDIALSKIVPKTALDVKEKVRTTSERHLFFEVRDKFMDKIDQAPFHPVPSSKGTVPKVLSVSNGDAKKDSAVIAIAMDYDGAIAEHLKFEENYRDPEFERKFVALCNRFSPEVIAMSGYNVNLSQLHKRIEEIVKANKLVVEVDTEEDYDPNAPAIELPVIYVPNETGRLFEHSNQADQEFSDKPVVAKFCIGIARYVQSPLLEYMHLGDAITSISVHKHQSLLPEEKIRQAIDSIFVDVTCLVGVKINDAVRSQYLSIALQYVAGLGPRKAANLLRGIESRGGALIRRDDLVLNHLTSKNIFMNCAPFFELPAPDRYDKDVELLDATRIHPEDYELARKMAADALDIAEEEKQEIEQEEGGLIGKLYDEGADKLDDLLLEGYADQLEEHGHRKRSTLEMIKEELQNNYEELRKSFHLLTDDEIFQLLTNETKETFQRGSLVTAIIQRIDNRFIVAQSQSGVSCNISRQNIVAYGDNTNLMAKYQIGQAVQAVIKSIDYATFRAELSLLKEDFENSVSGKIIEKFKGLWDFEAEKRDDLQEQEREQKDKNMKRFLKHPYFHNFNSKQAEDYLASKPNGEFVIRPSSRGVDHLTITWKIDNQLFQHIDVVEYDKPNEYSLGRKLQVGQFKYHDLDELIVSHINSLYMKVEAMKNHEKFRNEPINGAKDWLVRYSKANKNRSTYCFCYNHKAPGWFCLLFKLGNASEKTYTWNIKVLPTGYELHNNLYPDMVHLCNGFKKLLQNQLDKKNGYAGTYSRY